MTPELEELLLKALYAGYKYQLCVSNVMNDMQDEYLPGDFDTKKLDEYYEMWKDYSRRAVALHQQLEGGDES